MKDFFNKKNILIFIAILGTMLIVASGLLYFFLKSMTFTFKLVGDSSVTLNIYESYNDLGVKAYIKDKDLSNDVVIDTSLVDINKIGTYEVTYKIKYKDKEKTLKREVEVKDIQAPVITLNGEEEVSVTVGSTYNDLGGNVVDNYDEKASNKLKIENYVNTNLVGRYEVIYQVTDTSGNTSKKTRIVNVLPVDDTVNDITGILESNLITSMKFIDNGISITGYVKDNNGTFKMKLCEDNKKKCISYEMNKIDDYYYDGSIDLSNLKNGTYYMWINSKIDEKAVNRLEMQYRIVRAKIGDKLIGFNYDNDNVKIKVEDFEYKYDILIDPGHGGSDSGALNSSIDERKLNLEQSLYEKKRYEEHGLKVLMLREDESYGMTMGDSSWPAVRKKAYALGFYGVVSKVTYSNHHNSSEDLSMTGWEIITSSDSSDDELEDIYKIGESWRKNYNTLEEHIRIYTRNYNTASIFSKENKEQYYFTDYYAVIRFPYQLFNIRNTLFEGCYLSNSADFNWYYNENNWKKMSEEKIKVYVEKLGKKYIEVD